MAKEKRKVKTEEPPGVGDWIVTFSDCMTLLLCFFVLLLTFSSFDEASLKRFGGAFVSDQLQTGIQEKPTSKDSLVESPDVPDRHASGSETANDQKEPDDKHDLPESNWLPEQDAYSDRKIIHIPSSRLFRGGGSDLSGRGHQTLDVMAEFLSEMPCRVVVSESTPCWTTKGRTVIGRQAGLARAWAVVDYLTKSKANGGRGLQKDQFSISTSQQSPVTGGRAGAVVEVVMLTGRAHR